MSRNFRYFIYGSILVAILGFLLFYALVGMVFAGLVRTVIAIGLASAITWAYQNFCIEQEERAIILDLMEITAPRKEVAHTSEEAYSLDPGLVGQEQQVSISTVRYASRHLESGGGL